MRFSRLSPASRIPLALTALALPVLAAVLLWPPSPARAQSGLAPLSPPLSSPRPRTKVLIELFTSEGCSSCPSADAALMQLVREQPLGDIELIGLEEHVDYWNQLGWSDPFSSPLFSSRQEAYLPAVGRGRLYTPQAVIDGRLDALGSDRQALLQAAREAAAQPHATARVELARRTPQALELRAEAALLPGQSGELWIALVEDGLATQVPRGENAGRTLPHAAVVRALLRATQESGGALAGSVSIPLDPSWNALALRPIAFVQEPRSRRILAAAAR